MTAAQNDSANLRYIIALMVMWMNVVDPTQGGMVVLEGVRQVEEWLCELGAVDIGMVGYGGRLAG